MSPCLKRPSHWSDYLTRFLFVYTGKDTMKLTHMQMLRHINSSHLPLHLNWGWLFRQVVRKTALVMLILICDRIFPFNVIISNVITESHPCFWPVPSVMLVLHAAQHSVLWWRLRKINGMKQGYRFNDEHWLRVLVEWNEAMKMQVNVYVLEDFVHFLYQCIL